MVTGFSIAFPSDFDDFNGASHNPTCHFGTLTLSSTGYISIVSSSGDTVEPGEIFILSVQVKTFTEANGDELKLGFPSGSPGRGDNKQFSFNTTRVSADITSGDSVIFDFEATAPLTDQLYTLTADAIWRQTGSTSVWATEDFAITVQSPPSDNSPPEVIIINPNNNEYVNDNVLINASVIDSGAGVNTVWAEISNATSYNQTIPMSLSINPYYDGTWDSTSVFDGLYTITVKANDSATPSNLNNTESIDAIVDNTAPSISLDSVLPDPSNGITTITATNYSSDINSDGIRATISTPGSGDIFLDLIYQGSDKWNNTFSVVEDGTYSVEINATDNVGNVNVISPVVITGDITDPFADITNPANDGDSLGGNTIALSGWAYGTGTDILEMYINDTRWGTVQQRPQSDPSGSLNGPFSFENNTYISPGSYSVEINITDSAGNFNVSKRSFEVLSSDIFPPVLTITQINPNPSNGFTSITVLSNEDLVGPPLLNITAPNNSVIYRSMYPTGVPKTWVANYTVLDTGTYVININGTDLNSNVGYVSDSFNGDLEAPWIMINNVSPDPSNGLTIITASNASADIDINGLWATITTPSGSLFVKLNYQGSNVWNGTFIVTEDGTYSIRVNATDYAGNTNNTASVNINGDITPPQISLINLTPDPSNGLTTIIASNSSADINTDGIWATITTPSGLLYAQLDYQGSNLWNSTFLVTEDGTYLVQINATDYAGNTNTTSAGSIAGDISAPIITITSPSGTIGATAPDFSISITEVNLDSTWYSLFNGTHWLSNVTFNGLTGTIQQALWDALPEGDIIIRFYANDTLGYTGFKDVTIIKEIPDPGSNGDPDSPLISILDLGLIIGTILAIPGILIILVKILKPKRYFK